MFHSKTAQQCQQFDDHLTPIGNRQEGDRETDAAYKSEAFIKTRTANGIRVRAQPASCRNPWYRSLLSRQ